MGYSALLRSAVLVFACVPCVATLAQDPSPTPVREADAICGQCHRQILRTYLDTPMANASGVATDRVFTGSFHHAPSGVDYQVSIKDGSLWLSYARAADPDLMGRLKLRYYLGSGHLGITYLYTLNGYLLESPVAYYANSQSYDLKPGYERLSTMPSALPMYDNCMRCHMSDVQPGEPRAPNRFPGLPFLHGGITCEACHGDTAKHVAAGGKAAVLNPIKLNAERRDSICISCHLEGDVSIEHLGRSLANYKPGQPIGDYISYFVYAGDQGKNRGVSEIEELYLSKCKQASGDRMSCMSCHDPHYTPPAEERVRFYRSKCLACHSQAEYATSHHPDNPDCTSCHMPKGKAQNVPHVAWTDHRLRKIPKPADAFVTSSSTAKLTPLLAKDANPRDLALAYYRLLTEGKSTAKDRVQTLLSQANDANPQDPPVLGALGYLAQWRGDADQAMDFYRRVLKLDPTDLSAANNLAALLARSGQLKAAAAMSRETFEENQDLVEPGINLATMQCALSEKQAARQTLKEVLVYSPDQTLAQKKLRAIDSGQQTCAGPKDVN
jgi:tetratricopeptide (TPR) repeat protein